MSHAAGTLLAPDMSSSVAGERLDQLREASRAVLGQLKPADQGALISFSHLVRLGAGLNADVRTVEHALEEAEPSGDTALVDGIYAALTLAESDPGRTLIIVFSGGLDTCSWLTAGAVLDTARRSDGVVYAVAVGRFKADFLRELTSLTGGHLFAMEKTANLSAIFRRVIDEFRHRYLVSYTPRGGVERGGAPVDGSRQARRHGERAARVSGRLLITRARTTPVLPT